jgi:two-component system, sensor histidine kinase
MYGDFVNALCYSLFTPFYLYLWIKEPSISGRNVTLSFTFTAIFSWLSCWRATTPVMSLIACVGNSATIASMNLYHWPHPDEIVAIPQFLWSLLIISGNTGLSFSYKAGMAMIALTTAITVLVIDEAGELKESVPILLGATSVHLLFHFYTSRAANTRGLVTAHGASLILAGTFAYHMSSELIGMLASPGYAKEGGYSILKGAFFALVGLAAAGAFRQEIDMKETLEALVKERSKEILEQAERLRIVELALQASETSIAITNSKYEILWSNPALQRLTKKKEKELSGTTLLKALELTEQSEELSTWFCDTNPTLNSVNVQQLNMEIEISPFPNEKDTTNGTSRFLVVLHDITAEKARERAETAAVREAMAAQAMQESMQTLSHELRTPLQGIMGMTSLLLDDGELPDNVKDSMTVVMTSARLLLTLINNMLDVRKCDNLMMDEFPLRPLNLSPALATAVDFCKPFAGISGVKLEFDESSDQSEIHVQSNALRFQQILINLTSNAIKYSEDGSSVEISVKTMSLRKAKIKAAEALTCGSSETVTDGNLSGSSQVAVVSIRDWGPGINEDQASKVFGKFTQLDTAPTNTIGGVEGGQPSGTGLGLNLCLKFVQRMHGNIWVENNSDKGTTFSFYLPVVSSVSNTSQRKLKRGSTTAEKRIMDKKFEQEIASATKEWKVLIVDDTVINLKVFSRILQRVGVGLVDTASSGPKALELMKHNDFNLIFTDLQMPEMTGMELTKLILPEGKDAPDSPIVIGLTAEVSESVDAQCRSVGMSDVLHKPITAEQMVEFFRSIASRSKKPPTQV